MRRARLERSDITGTGNDRRAVIMGRHCLAYRHLICSTCYERCPEQGAIVRVQGLPRVITDKCTGCRVCHDVCPAPTNAVLMVTGRSGAHPIGAAR